MSKNTTGDFARALLPVFPIVTDDMVRGWCEQGVLDYWRNPLGGRYFPKEQSMRQFLLETMKYSHDTARGVFERMGLNFNQMYLLAA